MSAGAFSVTARYTCSEDDNIYRIKVQPETITTWNANSAGVVSGTGSVRVGGGNRQIGIKARSATLRWAAAPPAGYLANGLIRVPILTEGAYDALSLGATVQYLGTDAIVISKNPERVR
jgi:hypothetical protein